MITQEKRDEFKMLVYGFFRDNNDISYRDMAELLKFQFEFYAIDHSNERMSRNYKERISEQSRNDFSKMWEKFVQEVIDYVRDHEDVRKLIADEKDDLREEWKSNSGDKSYIMEPDVRMFLNIDGLDESVKEGKWTAATDSAIGLSVGSRHIIHMM